MIRLLKGIVELIDYPHLVIDVHGVGYHVYASNGIISAVNGVGQEMKIFTYTHVREDTLELYGFVCMEDLALFENLLSVSGIGPKTAIGIFSVGSGEQIVQAVVNENVAFFSGVPRLGKKNAQKIIIELRNKVKLDGQSNGVYKNGNDEVTTALLGFGFTMQEVSEAVSAIGNQAETVSEKVRLALKYLGK